MVLEKEEEEQVVATRLTKRDVWFSLWKVSGQAVKRR